MLICFYNKLEFFMNKENQEKINKPSYEQSIEKMVSNYVVMRVLKHYNSFKSTEIHSQ